MMAGYRITPEQGADMELSRMNRQLVDIIMVGQDPYEGCVTYVIVSELSGTDDPDRYATHQMMDWSAVNPGRGFALAYGHYMMAFDEAEEDMASRANGLLKDYDWVDPFSGDLIRNGRRCRRC